MWINIVIQILVSLFIIYILHYLYIYLKNTYSIKKTKDVVGFQVQKYQEIIQEMQNSKPQYISNLEKENMKSELSNLVINETI